jgi:Uma2 family endonuclease
MRGSRDADLGRHGKTSRAAASGQLPDLGSQLGGEALPGIGVLTRIGVCVPDITRQAQPTPDDPASPAPVLIVEVQSESNTRAELDAKVDATSPQARAR